MSEGIIPGPGADERFLYTAAQAERELGICASTIRTWYQRGDLHPMGLDRCNRPMYDGADLARLAKIE